MIEVFIGIDPSINSTGICLQFFEDDNVILTKFYAVVPENSLTKKAEKLSQQEEIAKIFQYVFYIKHDLKLYKDNHVSEYYKTLNILNIVNSINDIIIKSIKSIELDGYIINNIYVLQEGISYGSTKTKSVFDLAGLNYLIRNNFINNNKPGIQLIVATPANIKKFTTGNGNCNKEAMISLFKTMWPQLILQKLDDIADAYWMSCYARQIYLQNNYDITK